MKTTLLFVNVFLSSALQLLAQSASTPSPVVVPLPGTIIAAGGGASPEILSRFIEAAGGPEALILVVPTAQCLEGEPLAICGERASRPVSEEQLTAGLKAMGAKNLLVLHTRDRNVSDSDTFVAPIKRANGVWSGGGQPNLVVQAYAGTKTEEELRLLLARGGVIGGTSSGAVILGSRFADYSDDLPDDELRKLVPAFGFIRDTVIWAHVTSRNRLPMFEKLMADHPGIVGLAATETSAWLVRGNTATVIGTGDAFVFGKDPANPGRQYLTLHPGDQFDLASRSVRRAGNP
jgi:cyanophycinase